MPTTGVPSEGSTFPATAKIPTAASTLVPGTTDETSLATETSLGTTLYIETTSPGSLVEQITVGVSKTMPTSGVPSEGSTFPTTARIPTAASTLLPRTTEESTLATETSLGTTLSTETTSSKSLTEQTTVGVPKTRPTSGVPSEGSTFPTTASIPTAASTFVPRTINDITLGTETTYGPTFSIETTSPSSLTEQTIVEIPETMPTSGVPSEGSTFPTTARIPTAASTLLPRTTEESTLATETSLGTTLSTETTSSKSLTEQTTVGVPKTRPTSGVPSEGSTFPTTASIPIAASTFVPRTIDDTTLGTETTYGPTFSIETTSPSSLTEQTIVEVPETRPTSGVPSERSTFPTAASIPTAASTLVPRTTDETSLATETSLGTTHYIETTSSKSLTELTTVGVSQTMPTTGVPSEGSTFPATAKIPTAASTLVPGTTDETSLATETSLGTTLYIETTSPGSLNTQPLESLRPGQQVEFLQNALLSQRLPVSLLLHQLLTDNSWSLSDHANNWSSFRRLDFPRDCQNSYCCINSSTRNYRRDFFSDGDFPWHNSLYRNNFFQIPYRTDNSSSPSNYAHKWSSFRRLYFPNDCQNPYCCINSCTKNDFSQFLGRTDNRSSPSNYANKWSSFRRLYFPNDCQIPYYCINSCTKNY
ncbi:mucin-22-like [Drosophila tropicalis]|uniref:mucin-22-like n=1 Tax=Drosophila tropicalis TaxID=46794 RepID=UPI0035ABFA5A